MAVEIPTGVTAIGISYLTWYQIPFLTAPLKLLDVTELFATLDILTGLLTIGLSRLTSSSAFVICKGFYTCFASSLRRRSERTRHRLV